MKQILPILLFTLSASLFIYAADDATGTVVLEENFEKAEGETLPKGFMVLEGEFTVREVNGNKALYLPEDPLSDFGVLFGPGAKANIEVRARISSEARRRLTPRFGVGLSGANGYKLMATPGRKVVELMNGQEAVAQAPFEWESGKWLHFALRIVPKDGQWIVQGKVWTEDREEPQDWLVQYNDIEEPKSGKPSVWGAPYSGRAILFDDLAVKQWGAMN